MTHEELTDLIRASIENRLKHSELPQDQLVGERILLDQGNYCGRMFEWPNAKACWFIEEQQVKIYDRSGGLLMSFEVDPQELAHPVVGSDAYRRAA